MTRELTHSPLPSAIDVFPRRFAIVLQTPKDQHSSVYQTYQALGAELVRRGHTVAILTPQDLSPSRRHGGRWTPLVHPLAVARWMRRHNSSFTDVIFHSYAGWAALATGSIGRVRATVAFHGLEPIYHSELLAQAGGALSWRYRLLQERLMPLFLRTACRRADLVMCLNRAEVEHLVARGWADRPRIATVAHGVSDQFFLPERAPRRLRSLLFVAQWLPMKGVATLRDAFIRLARRHAELELVCAGTLVSANDVMAEFPEDVRPRIAVLPRVDRSALVGLYRQADVFVFPSHYEGFGVAIVEAMAARLPIVTTAVGVALDSLEDGTSALLVPKRDPHALTVALERLIDDAGLRRRLGEGAVAAAAAYREADRLREWADRLTGEGDGR